MEYNKKKKIQKNIKESKNQWKLSAKIIKSRKSKKKIKIKSNKMLKNREN